jgi:DNA-binding MarR family transcriptional regulator
MLQRARESHERTVAGIRRLEQRLTFKFAVVQRQLDRQLARILAEHDLSVTAYRVMAIIEAFGETSAAQLGRMGGLDKGLVSRNVADLTARGLLVTRADPTNGRRRILGLTPAGREKLAALRPAVDARNAALHGLFDEEELSRLHAALDALTDHLARDLDDRAEPAAASAPAAK